MVQGAYHAYQATTSGLTGRELGADPERAVPSLTSLADSILGVYGGEAAQYGQQLAAFPLLRRMAWLLAVYRDVRGPSTYTAASPGARSQVISSPASTRRPL